MTGPTQWIRPEVQRLSAYAVPEVGDVVKLDAMENPYPWPEPDLRPAWLDELASVGVNRYPDPRSRALVERLHRHWAVPASQRVLLGNGSDELIQLLTMAVARPGAKVLVPEPTFVMYRMIATFCGLECVGVPLAKDFALDADALIEAIEAHEPAIVWLAWPNNPTGNLWPREAIERVLERAPGLVVVDEAYQPFAQDSFIGDLERWPHLAVLRTMSKLGLAGLRLGALVGPPDWLDEIDKLRLPYNVNVVTQTSVAFALDHFDRLEAQAATIRRERERLNERLAALPGVVAYPSAANFVLVRVPAGRASQVHADVLERGVLIKKLDGAHPQLRDCLRVTVGTPEQNEHLIEAMGQALT